MKRVKLFFTAAAVLAVVGGALAFKAKAFNTGTVDCFATAPTTTESCTFPGQPVSQNVDFAVSSLGRSINPCAAFPGTTPYDASVAGACTIPTVLKFIPVAH